MILSDFNFKKFWISLSVNITLVLPALYYVFVEKNFFFLHHIDQKINFITSIGFTYTIIFFYLIPFIVIQKKV